ncbi:hypothetical protein PA3071 [hydrothermal vent metagenome]|uniref:VWFA domain-containing protein n=1 Tax=hydrothermal vent metagenome TaxID=652676 RepID=A0A3B0TAE9_9ZZZZ
MIPKDLFKKVKQIEIKTSRLVSNVFAGQYHSAFKGQGIEFDEVREYNIGDDVRAIDWNVTARMGKPYIKKFVEERELTVMILVDVSLSCRFGSVSTLKSQIAAEVASLLALSAIRNNDKVGLILFTNEIEVFIPPRKGSSHVLRMIREILYFQPKGKLTDLSHSLEYLNRVVSKKSIAFLISDFYQDDADGFLKKSLSITNRHHDLIAITLNDPREEKLEDCGLISLEEAETGQTLMIDSSNALYRQQYIQLNQERLNARKQLFRGVGMDSIDISTEGSYSDEIIKFFMKRRHRM